jgi:hypothetical protein
MTTPGFHGKAQERRRDQLTADTMEVAIIVRYSLGAVAAEQYMVLAGLPERLATRVQSNVVRRLRRPR